MDNLLQGKFFRTDTVVGALYSPMLGEFLQEVSTGTEVITVLPENNREIYQLPDDLLRNMEFGHRPNAPLYNRDGDVNRNVLRVVGIGDDRGFHDPLQALEKWYPSGCDKRESWLEYIEQRGFEREQPPNPPGVTIRANSKFSNRALQSVIERLRDATQHVHKQFVQPVEMSFTVEVETNE